MYYWYFLTHVTLGLRLILKTFISYEIRRSVAYPVFEFLHSGAVNVSLDLKSIFKSAANDLASVFQYTSLTPLFHLMQTLKMKIDALWFHLANNVIDHSTIQNSVQIHL